MGNSKSKKTETYLNGLKNRDPELHAELNKIVQSTRDKEYQTKREQEELERKSKDPEEIRKLRHRLGVYLIEINSPMRLDDYIKLNEYYQHIEMFNEFKPAKAYYVVPLASMTTRLYNAAKQLNQISQIKFFSKSAKNVQNYNMELYDTHYIVLKITKPILDKLLEPEDITKELELLAKFTSNKEFTSTPAKELTYKNLKVNDEVVYSWSDFENTFKLKFKPHGFLMYKVRKNKIDGFSLSELHDAYLYYYSDNEQFGWLCYPEKDAKKIASLENLDEKEQTEILAEMLGVQLDQREPEFTAVAELPKPVEQEGSSAEQEGSSNEMITAVADWPKPPERIPSVEGEEGQQIQLN